MKRNAEVARYIRSFSKASHFRLILSATSPVVFEPAKISRTTSPGSVRKATKNSGIFAGKRAGWGLAWTILQHSMYFELLSVFGTLRMFGGMAPPLSSLNLSLMSCPDGLFFGV